MESKKQSERRWLVPALLIVIILLVIALFLMRSCSAETTNIEDGGVPKIGYAEGVTALDESSLQAAMDDAIAKAAEGTIALSYKNTATSTDGTNFDCYIGNSLSNNYDMYIDIYADQALTDEIFLSGLFRPGEAFKEIELTHPLAPGTHTVYVAYTQVEEDQATIHAQVVVTMEFVVNE